MVVASRSAPSLFHMLCKLKLIFYSLNSGMTLYCLFLYVREPLTRRRMKLLIVRPCRSHFPARLCSHGRGVVSKTLSRRIQFAQLRNNFENGTTTLVIRSVRALDVRRDVRVQCFDGFGSKVMLFVC